MTLDEALAKYRKTLPGGGQMLVQNNANVPYLPKLDDAPIKLPIRGRAGSRFPNVKSEHFPNTTPADLAAKVDVIFGPGVRPGGDPLERDTGFVSIDANAKGREAVEAIFPTLREICKGGGFDWKRGVGFNEIWPEAFGSDWQSCAPTIPALAAEVPNTLPEHLTKHKPLDLCSEDQLTFIMAIAARNHGARAAWVEMDGPKIKSVNMLDGAGPTPDSLPEFESRKREPRTIPLSANYAPKAVRSILAGRKLHLFELSIPLMEEILRMPLDERKAELEGLKEFDLLRLPFGTEPIAIRFNLAPVADAIIKEGHPLTPDERQRAAQKTFTAIFGGECELAADHEYAMASVESQMLCEHGGVSAMDILRPGGQSGLMAAFMALTVLLLAMNDKNIVKRDRLKDAKKKSLRGLTAGPQGIVYLSRTVLEAPEDLPLEPGTHASPRAHRRRGHKHTVLFGAGRTGRRVQWFPAVWVNGDPPADWKPTIYEVQE